MYAVSQKFLDTLSGSHKVITRARVFVDPQFTATPVGGVEIPIIDGDVKLTSTSDIKGTLDLTTSGEFWDRLKPFASEVFVERGIDYGDGTTELVPLGYFRIEDIKQDNAPNGNIQVTGNDRIAQLQQNRVLFPYQAPVGITHRKLFNRLVNGNLAGDPSNGPSSEGYGMYIYVQVPIVWNSGYNPDTTVITGTQVDEDSTYDFLAKIVDGRGCVLRFDRSGQLTIVKKDLTDGTIVYAIKDGDNGTLVNASRSMSRTGVYNIVSAYGSDPSSGTGYQVSYNENTQSPLVWFGKFGAAPRYYSSPLLTTTHDARSAADTVLAQYSGLPYNLGLSIVPNPALEPLDVISVQLGNVIEKHVVDEVTIPLTVDQLMTVKTRTLTTAEVVIVDPQPDPDPDPDPDPGDPDDGTQAAVVEGWGAVIEGDEFEYTGAPDGDLWGVYDGAGHNGNGTRTPDAWSVSGGILTCTGDADGNTGGMAFTSGHKYGRWEIRMRTGSINPSGGGDRYHPVLLTWPDSDVWPRDAEYDFAETDCDAGEMSCYLHFPNHQPITQLYFNQELDIQNWHNYAFEWLPGSLTGWIDGVQWFRTTRSDIQAPGPMHLCIQLDNFSGGTMAPAKMECKWFRFYDYQA